MIPIFSCLSIFCDTYFVTRNVSQGRRIYADPSRGTGGARGGENSLSNPPAHPPPRRFMLWVLSDKLYQRLRPMAAGWHLLRLYSGPYGPLVFFGMFRRGIPDCFRPPAPRPSPRLGPPAKCTRRRCLFLQKNCTSDGVIGIPGGTFRIRLAFFAKNVPPTVLGISGNAFHIQ
jgi:hypothetical protein